MKTTRVTVRWQEGLHLRAAAGLVKRAHGLASHIVLRVGETVADAASILNVVILCAGMGMIIEVEATGPDEEEAVAMVEAYFDTTLPDTLDADFVEGASRRSS